MILINLIFGAVVGRLIPVLEPMMKRFFERMMLTDIKLADTEFDLLCLLVLLMIAAFFCAVIGVDSSAFMLCLGALLGLFGPRIWAVVMNRDEDA